MDAGVPRGSLKVLICIVGARLDTVPQRRNGDQDDDDDDDNDEGCFATSTDPEKGLIGGNP